MSRPMIANPKRKSEAAAFHRLVFKAWGSECFFCARKATDAMHIIPRSQLGPLRYEIPVENARPGCRECHDRVDRGEIAWPKRVLAMAIRAHNKIAKVRLPLP